MNPFRKATAVVGTYAAKIEAEEEEALTRPTPTSEKATPVVGTYACKIEVEEAVSYTHLRAHET